MAEVERPCDVVEVKVGTRLYTKPGYVVPVLDSDDLQFNRSAI